MTAPTITYRSGLIDDCNVRTTTWSADGAHENGLVSTMTTDGDIFTIAGTTDNVGADEYAYYERDVSALAINTTTYPQAAIRWKTSEAASGVGVKLIITYTAGSGGGQTIVLDVSLSTSWTVTTTALTSGRVIDKIHIYVDDSPDSVANGTYYAYVDWIRVQTGTFTWPFGPSDIEVEVANNYADAYPTNLSHYVNPELTTIQLRGSIDTNTSWHGAYSFDEEYLYQITHEACTDQWQWFTSDRIKCKVTPRNLVVLSSGRDSEGLVMYQWTLKEYRLKPARDTSYTERFYDQ